MRMENGNQHMMILKNNFHPNILYIRITIYLQRKLKNNYKIMIQVKIVNKSNNPLPEYAHVGDAGMDLRANLSEPVTIDPFKRKLIPTGLYIQMPQDDGYCYEAQVRPRSGLALKYGISVCNTPGTIN